MATVYFASKNYKSISKQKGIALLLFVFALILVVLAYSVKALNSNELKARQNEKTMSALGDAKLALIAWAVNNLNRPGLMPYPDRNGDGNYDGNSDCYTTTTLTGNYDKLLGKLPWRAADDANCTTLISGIGREFKDSTGEPLWYAVSRNIVYDYKTSVYPVINPSIIDNNLYPWLEVYDKNGQLISNKVAAIIIAPGAPLDNQDRSSGIADATNYLDTFNLQVGGGAKSNRTYAVPDEDFYIGENSGSVRSDNTTYQQPYYFNDKLIYITIDELMAEVEKRAAGEVRAVLQKYYKNNNFYPYAAALGSTTNPNQCVQGNLQGLLPINTPSDYTCSCTGGAQKNCACSFAAVSSISFIRTSGSYATSGSGAPTGACSVPASDTCQCQGQGTCSQTTNKGVSSVEFSCDACGSCTSTVNGSYSFTTTGVLHPTPGVSNCSQGSPDNITCSLVPNPSFYLDACSDPKIPTLPGIYGLPTWFAANSWQNYIYYAVSNNCTSPNKLSTSCTTASPQLKVGLRTGIRSLLISSGKPIIASPFALSKAAAQIARPSCDVKDYLDSSQNTNATLVNGSADMVYDAINTARGLSYNDQMFTVAP